MIIDKKPIGSLKGERFFELTQAFNFYSDILNCWVIIPIGFTCDFESIPLVQGLCRTGGIIHDYLCRVDSKPVVNKKIAANVYRETLQHFKHSKWKIFIKYWAVRICTGYFHKMKVLENNYK